MTSRVAIRFETASVVNAFFIFCATKAGINTKARGVTLYTLRIGMIGAWHLRLYMTGGTTKPLSAAGETHLANITRHASRAGHEPYSRDEIAHSLRPVPI
jgi:hypothetical protein